MEKALQAKDKKPKDKKPKDKDKDVKVVTIIARDAGEREAVDGASSSMDIAKWRRAQLRKQSPPLKAALQRWQSGNTIMRDTMRAMVDAGINMEVAVDVAQIWNSLQDAPPLPDGTLLWRAVAPMDYMDTGLTKSTGEWMPVSVTLQGAEAYAKKKLADGKAIICEIQVSGEAVRAVAVGSDEDYEHEKEILIAPGFSFEAIDTPAEHTAAGNPIKTYIIRGD